MLASAEALAQGALPFRTTSTLDPFECPCIRTGAYRAKGPVMNALTLPQHAPVTRTCPNCQGEMTVTRITPVIFTDGHDDITYHCAACGSELRRTYKRPEHRAAMY